MHVEPLLGLYFIVLSPLALRSRSVKTDRGLAQRLPARLPLLRSLCPDSVSEVYLLLDLTLPVLLPDTIELLPFLGLFLVFQSLVLTLAFHLLLYLVPYPVHVELPLYLIHRGPLLRWLLDIIATRCIELRHVFHDFVEGAFNLQELHIDILVGCRSLLYDIRMVLLG